MIERFNGRIAKAIKEYKTFKGEFKTKQELFNFIIWSFNFYLKHITRFAKEIFKN